VLRADGGAVGNRWLMQFQADLIGVPVVVPENPETTALGAAYLAGIGAGVWDLGRVAEMWRAGRTFEPRMGRDQAGELRRQWQRALRRSRNWVEPEAIGTEEAAPNEA